MGYREIGSAQTFSDSTYSSRNSMNAILVFILRLVGINCSANGLAGCDASFMTSENFFIGDVVDKCFFVRKYSYCLSHLTEEKVSKSEANLKEFMNDIRITCRGVNGELQDVFDPGCGESDLRACSEAGVQEVISETMDENEQDQRIVWCTAISWITTCLSEKGSCAKSYVERLRHASLVSKQLTCSAGTSSSLTTLVTMYAILTSLSKLFASP